MPILSVLVLLIVAGFCLYLLNLLPLDATMKQIIRVVVIFLVVIWLISLFAPSGLELFRPALR